MRIKSVEFAGAIGAPGGPAPGTLPQVAFSGRSNVGKSSLINRLLGRTRTHIARVSVTPGKTQEINFYEVRAEGNGGEEQVFYAVDLPGYGYARVPEALRKKWRPMIEAYLSGTEPLRGVVQLVDARRGLNPDDRRMVDYLAELELPTLIAMTKVDKLGRAERREQTQKVVSALGADPEQVIEFSSKSGEGRDELLESIGALLQPEEETK